MQHLLECRVRALFAGPHCAQCVAIRCPSKPRNSSRAMSQTADLCSAARRSPPAGAAAPRHRARPAAADSPAVRHAFIRRFDGSAGVAECVDAQRRAGAPPPPLAGLAVSVKDLFDVAGAPDHGGLGRARRPAARQRRLPRRGTPARGRRGARRPHEPDRVRLLRRRHQSAPRHARQSRHARLDATPRIPGGSTSGGAVSVAGGAAWAALGSDTGRLDPHSGGAAGPGRLQEHRAAGAHRRLHPAVDHARHGLRDHALGARRRAAARGARRAKRGAGAAARCARCGWRCRRTRCSTPWRHRGHGLRARSPRLRAAGAEIDEMHAAGRRCASRRPRAAQRAPRRGPGIGARSTRAGRLRPTRGHAHPPRQRHRRGRLHRPPSRRAGRWIAQVRPAPADYDAF